MARVFRTIYGPDSDTKIDGQGEIVICAGDGRVVSILGGTTYINGIYLVPSVGPDGCIHVAAYGSGTVPAGGLSYAAIVDVSASSGSGSTAA